MITPLTQDQYDHLKTALDELKPAAEPPPKPEPPVDPPAPATRIGVNPWELASYNHPSIADMPAEDVRFDDNRFTEPTAKHDNGASRIEGQFRIKLAPSHCAQVDPIVAFGQPRSHHLHMFFGNTSIDEFSTGASLAARGDSTSQGRRLNNSSYWIPALLSGPANDPATQIIYPKRITAYYKTKTPAYVAEIPVGLQMLAGNVHGGHAMPSIPKATPQLHWGIYVPDKGMVVDQRTTIPHDGKPGQLIRMALQYPNLVKLDSTGQPMTHSTGLDHYQHGNDKQPAPAGWIKIPTLSLLVDWEVEDDTKHWRLSSDAGYDTDDIVAHPGGSAHGDVIFAWHPATQTTWRQGCYIGPNGPRNCSNGQTGTARQLRDLAGRHVTNNQATHNIRVALNP